MEAEIQEARRLLYVGMTRAKDRLILTRAQRRAGLPTGGSLFLAEAGLIGHQSGIPPALAAPVTSGRYPMRLVACALPLLAGAPSVMAAQVTIALPHVQGPVVRATLGPIAVVATARRTRGERSRQTGQPPTHSSHSTVTKGHATAAGFWPQLSAIWGRTIVMAVKAQSPASTARGSSVMCSVDTVSNCRARPESRHQPVTRYL